MVFTVSLLSSNIRSIFLFVGVIVYFGACCRSSLGWFAFEPEWYDTKYMNFAHSEAQCISVFVNYLSNERAETDPKGRGRENGISLVDVVRC